MTNTEELARILFKNWQEAKRRRGVNTHVTDHNVNPQNILDSSVTWETLNADDKAFDLELLEFSLKEFYGF